MTRARELADLLTGGQTIATADNTTQLTLTSTDADASVGPRFDLKRDSGSPADGDTLGRVRFMFDNDAAEQLEGIRIDAVLDDASDGTEDVKLIEKTMINGSLVERVRHVASETVFNEDQQDLDFRVESDTQTHMLFVDAAGEQVMVGTSNGSLFNAEGTAAAFTVAGSDTSTTTIGNGGAAINIVQTNGTAGNTSGLHFSRQDTDGTPNYSGAAIVAQFPDAQATGQYPKGRLVFNTSSTANAAPSEKMRIDPDGSVIIGATSIIETNAILNCKMSQSAGTVAAFERTTTANARQLSFHNNNGEVGTINTSGSATSYNTSSDHRLKENVADMTGAIARVKQLAPKRFNFIADADTTVDGFLAHEAQTVVPEAITGTHNQVEVWVEPEVDDDGNIISGEALPDGVSAGDNKLDADGNTIPVYQGIDQSKLVPLLTGALQEAIAKIETLETKVAALEAG